MYIKNLNHVYSFLNVVKTGSISSASRLMRKSQTSVSNSVVSLEIELGVDLLIRDGQKAIPTEEAIQLIPYMENLLSYQRILSSIADEIFADKPELHIYIDQRVSSRFLDLLQNVILDHEDKTVNIHRGLDITNIQQSKRGDIYIVISIFNDLSLHKLDKKTLGIREDVIVVSAQNKRVQENRTVCFNEILNHRQIYVCNSIADVQSNPLSSKVCFVDSYDDAIHFIKNDFGWGILPYYVIEDELKAGSLIALEDKKKHDATLQHNVYCYFSPLLRNSPAFKTFIQHCKTSMIHACETET
ncbi:LysR family transcriptional regulator (plasmid) [Photobacterium sp. GJ3]|uniref:LysR family transcriptional regulator n=1 Tax=Photobacterium sp. GJ3 TaxID=2829502 RepID=UPI001B8B5735|nr:LysR family transcriptional regulator [Photobacterium sp. GJ3]QUJ70202.1 LysR family transcriptional regulator [Photobacterium sp. GJ3]